MADDALSLYKQFETEDIARKSRGAKGQQFIKFVEDLFVRSKERRLSLNALFRTAKKTLEQTPGNKVNRSYFIKVITENFETSADENSQNWVLPSKVTKKAAGRAKT